MYNNNQTLIQDLYKKIVNNNKLTQENFKKLLDETYLSLKETRISFEKFINLIFMMNYVLRNLENYEMLSEEKLLINIPTKDNSLEEIQSDDIIETLKNPIIFINISFFLKDIIPNLYDLFDFKTKANTKKAGNIIKFLFNKDHNLTIENSFINEFLFIYILDIPYKDSEELHKQSLRILKFINLNEFVKFKNELGDNFLNYFDKMLSFIQENENLRIASFFQIKNIYELIFSLYQLDNNMDFLNKFLVLCEDQDILNIFLNSSDIYSLFIKSYKENNIVFENQLFEYIISEKDISKINKIIIINNKFEKFVKKFNDINDELSYIKIYLLRYALVEFYLFSSDIIDSLFFMSDEKINNVFDIFTKTILNHNIKFIIDDTKKLNEDEVQLLNNKIYSIINHTKNNNLDKKFTINTRLRSSGRIVIPENDAKKMNLLMTKVINIMKNNEINDTIKEIIFIKLKNRLGKDFLKYFDIILSFSSENPEFMFFRFFELKDIDEVIFSLSRLSDGKNILVKLLELFKNKNILNEFIKINKLENLFIRQRKTIYYNQIFTENSEFQLDLFNHIYNNFKDSEDSFDEIKNIALFNNKISIFFDSFDINNKINKDTSNIIECFLTSIVDCIFTDTNLLKTMANIEDQKINTIFNKFIEIILNHKINIKNENKKIIQTLNANQDKYHLEIILYQNQPNSFCISRSNLDKLIKLIEAIVLCDKKNLELSKKNIFDLLDGKKITIKEVSYMRDEREVY